MKATDENTKGLVFRCFWLAHGRSRSSDKPEHQLRPSLQRIPWARPVASERLVLPGTVAARIATEATVVNLRLGAVAVMALEGLKPPLRCGDVGGRLGALAGGVDGPMSWMLRRSLSEAATLAGRHGHGIHAAAAAAPAS